MKKNKFLLLIVSPATIITTVVFFSRSETGIINTDFIDDKSNKISSIDKSIDYQSFQTSYLQTATSNIENNKKSSAGTKELENEQTVTLSAADIFLVSDTFKSPENLTSMYLVDDNTVSRESIVLSFQQKKFADLIEKIYEIDKTHDSIEREIKLGEKLFTQYGNKISNEFYACAGKVCAVSFDFDDINSDELNKLSSFSSNFAFYNTEPIDSGGRSFKGIYIETSDPSKLTLN